MAQQWYYKQDGTKHGPVTSQQLKQLAISGELRPSDSVCRDGRDDWKPAKAIKGLFNVDSAGPSIGSPDADATVTSDHSEADTLLSRATSVVRNFGASAKSAALIAAKQAELAKIQKVSLPAAYTSLGNEVYAAGLLRDHFQELFAEADELEAKIAEAESRATTRPKGSNFAEKAKAVGAAAKDKAAIQTHRVQISRVMARLGQAAFEKHGNTSGPTDCVNRVNALLDRCSVLESETRNQLDNGGGGGRARSFATIAAATFFCFPVGLTFVWAHPTWTMKSKLRWTGLCAVAALFFVVIGIQGHLAFQQQIVDAHQAWAAGDREAAAMIYREITKDGPTRIPESERPTIYGRLIDEEVLQGNSDDARRLVSEAKAYNGGFDPKVSDKTKRWITRMEEDDRREEARQSKYSAERRSGVGDEMATLLAATDDEIVSATGLIREYRDNEIASDTKYKGKSVIVEGIVREIATGNYVSLDSGLNVVRCYGSSNDASQTEKLTTLRKGDRVRVLGQCEGYSRFGVDLRNCVFLTPSEMLEVAGSGEQRDFSRKSRAFKDGYADGTAYGNKLSQQFHATGQYWDKDDIRQWIGSMRNVVTLPYTKGTDDYESYLAGYGEGLRFGLGKRYADWR